LIRKREKILGTGKQRWARATFFLSPQSQFRNLKEALPQSQFRNFKKNVAAQPQLRNSAIFGIFLTVKSGLFMKKKLEVKKQKTDSSKNIYG
jgi:thiosulfate reductase cytochrome b subunit